jgi:hypothetical protein
MTALDELDEELELASIVLPLIALPYMLVCAIGVAAMLSLPQPPNAPELSATVALKSMLRETMSPSPQSAVLVGDPAIGVLR